MKELDNAWLLPTRIRALYRETFAALDNEQPVLATVGLRALIEDLCTDKKAHGDSLK